MTLPGCQVLFLQYKRAFLFLVEISNCLWILCLATYGEGDPTDNAQSLYEFITTTDTSFQGIRFAVILDVTVLYTSIFRSLAWEIKPTSTIMLLVKMWIND